MAVVERCNFSPIFLDVGKDTDQGDAPLAVVPRERVQARRVELRDHALRREKDVHGRFMLRGSGDCGSLGTGRGRLRRGSRHQPGEDGKRGDGGEQRKYVSRFVSEKCLHKYQ